LITVFFDLAIAVIIGVILSAEESGVKGIREVPCSEEVRPDKLG